MEKAEFASYVTKNGYPCHLVNGIPSVHANVGDKAILKKVQELKKLSGYDQSFSIKYDGAAAIPDEDMVGDADESITEGAEEISEDSAKNKETAVDVSSVEDAESIPEDNNADLFAQSGFFDFDSF